MVDLEGGRCYRNLFEFFPGRGDKEDNRREVS